jgi:hypothetical protein
MAGGEPRVAAACTVLYDTGSWRIYAHGEFGATIEFLDFLCIWTTGTRYVPASHLSGTALLPNDTLRAALWTWPVDDQQWSFRCFKSTMMSSCL